MPTYSRKVVSVVLDGLMESATTASSDKRRRRLTDAAVIEYKVSLTTDNTEGGTMSSVE